MKRGTWVLYGTVIIALLAAGTTFAERPASTEFTYQGQLKENGVPVNNPAGAFRFALYDALTGGNSLGQLSLSDIPVVNGLFTATLDFGAGLFNGQPRWLEIMVNKPGTGWVMLTPRQAVTPAPEAQFAQNAAQLALPYIATYADYADGVMHVNYAGESGYGLRVDATGLDAGAIYGTTSEYDTVAISGFAAGAVSAGVGGFASATGPDAAGVGGSFTTNGDKGMGVYGNAQSSTGTNYGVRGRTGSPQGYAGYFEGRGYFSGNVGIGATPWTSSKLRVASSDSDALYVVSSVGQAITGESQSEDGAGVFGYNDADSGVSIGVYGYSNSPDGYGGYFFGRGYFSGNVGIGAWQPTQKLDVAGTIKATGFQLATSPTAGYVLTSDATGIGTWQPAGAASCLWHLNGSNIYYNAGKVAIGTTDPSYYPLRVVNNGGSTAISGECPGEGNYGYLGDEYAGVRGVGYYGVYGETTAATGTAVVGTAYGTGTLSNIGGSFSANGNTGTAVLGTASGTGAVSNIGGKFSAAGNTGTGVYGIASATTGDSFGVRAESNSTTGAAVYAEAKATSGTVNGVYAVYRVDAGQRRLRPEHFADRR